MFLDLIFYLSFSFQGLAGTCPKNSGQLNVFQTQLNLALVLVYSLVSLTLLNIYIYLGQFWVFRIINYLLM